VTSAGVPSAIESRFLTLSETAHSISRPCGVVNTTVLVSLSVDSIHARTVMVLANDTPVRGTACTWPCA